MKARHEYFALYSQLLKGRNLIRQKSWDRHQLEAFFPHDRESWEPWLTARQNPPPPDESNSTWRRMAELLDGWDDPWEEKILRRRWRLLGAYCLEADKLVCDQDSLQFFLDDIPVPPSLALPHAAPLERGKSYSPQEAQQYLEKQLLELYPEHETHVRLDSASMARASTGKNYIRLRDGDDFEHSELKTLTAHELWVHLGSNLQGTLQTEYPWLAMWHPGVTAFQEGLAIIAEIVAGHWSEKRRQEIILRHQAAIWGVEGHNANWIHHQLQQLGLDRVASLRMVLRVFRGCSLEGGMVFGKELLYGAGFMQWMARKEQLGTDDMRLALSGKMDFQEWEWLRQRKSSVQLATPPMALTEWNQNSVWKKKQTA